MKHYVLSFAHPIPANNLKDVLLIERQKKDWQHGLLNLPGGSVNDGETPEEAAVRELWEETSITASVVDTRLLGTLKVPDAIVDVCYCPYRGWYNGAEQLPKTMTDEGRIVSLPWRDAMNDPRLIPNLRIIIPYCFARLTGWTLVPAADDRTWVTSV